MEDEGVGDQEQCGLMSFRGISLTWDLIGWSVEEAEIAAQDRTGPNPNLVIIVTDGTMYITWINNHFTLQKHHGDAAMIKHVTVATHLKVRRDGILL